MNNHEYFIVFLFLFLQEFTRMKLSENKNKEREKNFLLWDGWGKGLNKIYIMWMYMYIWWIILYVYVIIMYMSSFLCFYFYENLQELNGVRMRMDGEKDEILFFESWERRKFVFIFPYGRMLESWLDWLENGGLVG